MRELERIISFQHFEPKTGPVPEVMEGKFADVAARARRLLANRSAEAIITLADLAEWCLGHDCVREQVWAHLTLLAEAIETEEASEPVTPLNELSALAKCTDTIPLAHFETELPGLTWAEVFAARALADIAEAADWFHFHVALQHRELDDPLILTMLGPYAVEAMEAICLAEAYTHIERRVEKAVRSKIKADTQRAAFQRHHATNALKRDFIEFWENGDYPSYAEAARRFIASLPEERRRLLAPTNAERTLITALSAYVKQSAG